MSHHHSRLWLRLWFLHDIVSNQRSPAIINNMPSTPSSDRTWQQELQIIDQTMRAISDVRDPEQLVKLYWEGIADLLPVHDHVALSRRHMASPSYLVTRSSRFEKSFNPWTQRDKLPHLAGGLLGELAYANKPVYIENLPERLSEDDPGWFYLQGFERLVALPQYENNESVNVIILLVQKDNDIDLMKIPLMHWHSSLFGRGTQNLVLRNQLAHALESLDSELKIVGEIQRTLLPDTLPEMAGFEFAADYQTSARAGGDYYDFFPLDNENLGLFIADVSGHGTPAAVLMAITHALAHSKPDTHTPPGQLLAHLNHKLTKSYLREGMFVTAFYAALDPATRQFTYARAGHNPPRLVRDDKVISLDAIGSLPMGVMEDETFEDATITLQPGDLLLFYTDGITEAMSPQTLGRRELFGQGRLDEVLLQSRCESAQACIDRVKNAIDHYTGHSQPMDDQTLIAIRCR